MTPTFAFLRRNAPFLAAGVLLSFLSSFGQTFFIAVFGGEVRAAYGLSHGGWGVIYMGGTAASAVAMVWAGALADRIRVRVLGLATAVALALACAGMAANASLLLLPFVIFALRFTGQGMALHLSAVAMARWFAANRGRALATAAMGVMAGEALLPLLAVWAMGWADWRAIWLVAAGVALAGAVGLHRLLRLERSPAQLAEAPESAGMGGRHWRRAEALRHPVFWLMVPAVMSFAGFATAFWFHQAHFAEVKGWSHLSLVAVFPLGTLALVLSTLVYGRAVDRFGAVRLLPVYLLPLVAAFVLHWAAGALWVTALAVVLMGVAGGGQNVLLSACWAEIYGTRHLGAIRAVASALMVAGSAIGPGVSGALIDAGVGFEAQQLGYAMVFAVAAALLLVARSRVRAEA